MTVARVGADGVLWHAGARYRAALGKGGIRAEKMERDEATPAGLLELRRVLFRADRVRRPRAVVPVALMSPSDGWCDDPEDRGYNTFVRLPYPGRHEELWRQDGLYDVVGVLGWNDAPPVKRRGSAIFLHVARPDHGPTEGCIAMALPDLLEVLSTLTAIEVG